MAHHDFTLIPASEMKAEVAKILKSEGFIKDFEVVKGKPAKMIKVYLKYKDGKDPVISGLERVSKPGLRVYSNSSEIPRVYGGLGIAILSTPAGVMTGSQAYRQKIGGEVLCYVW